MYSVEAISCSSRRFVEFIKLLMSSLWTDFDITVTVTVRRDRLF